MAGAMSGQMGLSCVRKQIEQSRKQASMWHFSIVSAFICYCLFILNKEIGSKGNLLVSIALQRTDRLEIVRQVKRLLNISPNDR